MLHSIGVGAVEPPAHKVAWRGRYARNFAGLSAVRVTVGRGYHHHHHHLLLLLMSGLTSCAVRHQDIVALPGLSADAMWVRSTVSTAQYNDSIHLVARQSQTEELVCPGGYF